MPMSIEQEAAIGRTFRRNAERLMSLCVLLFGIVIVLSDGIFDEKYYALLRIVAPEDVWGVLFIMIGAVRTVFLIVNGYYPQSAAVRGVFAGMTLFFFWTPITFSSWWLAIQGFTGHGGSYLPLIVLAPALATFECLCIFALSALHESKKGDGSGAS